MLNGLSCFRQLVISDEGKDRLKPPQEELTCSEDMTPTSSDGQQSDTISTSNKRSLVELSEADSTVTNGFDATESQRQDDGMPPAKKQHYTGNMKETDDNYHHGDNASSTTSSPHETVSNFFYCI